MGRIVIKNTSPHKIVIRVTEAKECFIKQKKQVEKAELDINEDKAFNISDHSFGSLISVEKKEQKK